jgi:hypothetical protein
MLHFGLNRKRNMYVISERGKMTDFQIIEVLVAQYLWIS